MEADKKGLLLSALIIIGLAFGYRLRREVFVTESPVPVPVVVEDDATLSQSHLYCFVYRHTATTTEPYTVEEHLTISGTRDHITGTKSGTQAGPDMTNGYSGKVTGSAASNTMTLLYSYVIEGSEQKEQEIYTFFGHDLRKEVYQLTERDGVLVPTTVHVTDRLYERESCR